MSQIQLSKANPFVLLLDPQSVFQAIEKSERLERLHSRVCRPLDKPLLSAAVAECDVHEITCPDLMDLPGEEI